MNIDAKAKEIIEAAGERPDGIIADMIRAALLSVRNEALEEAAKVADSHVAISPFEEIQRASNAMSARIATAIRALKTEVGA